MKHTPNICFVTEDFYPVMHGVTTHLLQVADHLSRRGSRVTVLTRRVKKEHPRREEKDGFQIVRVMPAIGMHRLGKYLMIMPAFFALYNLRRIYDVIIVCDLKALGVLGVIAGKCFGKRCFLRAESCGEMDGSYALKRLSSTAATFLMKKALRVRNWILSYADGYLSISSAIDQEFIQCGIPIPKIKKLPNGIDLKRFEPVCADKKQSLRESMGLPEEKIFIYTGRLAQGKGLDILLEVWKELAARTPDTHLVLVGSGQGYAMSCETELRDFVARNQLSHRVTFTGNVSNVQDYLQAADFFVLPSQMEGLPLSLLEAMACGLPCIATDVGGIKDIIEDGVDGCLVPYEDARLLLQAMCAFLSDSDRAWRLGLVGREKVQKKYDLDHLADRYLTLL